MADPVSKTLIYAYDPDEEYTYNSKHGTEYPYNSFPKGAGGRVYKKTRFNGWVPIPEDIIVRHYGAQIHVNFSALFDKADFLDPNVQLFNLRAKRPDVQNYICEQINFFAALYDPNNDLLTSMLAAKIMTDSQIYTMETFDEYYVELHKTLFSEETMKNIERMVDENDVGDDTIGLFHPAFLKDMFILTFQIKIMHIYIDHFIISTGNQPRYMYDYYAKAYQYAMDQINPKMYPVLYAYVNKKVVDTIKQNSNIYDMQSVIGVTEPTTVSLIMRKSLLCDGLFKLTFANGEWDPIMRRPKQSCVGLIKAIIQQATGVTKKVPLERGLMPTDDMAQLLDYSIESSSPICTIRSFNAGEFCCTQKDLEKILAQISLEIDISPVDFYLENLVQINDLAKILVDSVLYNKFHSSISTMTISARQRYILLLYVRHIIMDMYMITEMDSVANPLINLIMGKTSMKSTRTLTQKDINNIKKYAKLSVLKQYLIHEKNVSEYIDIIQHTVLSSYTIVNHNAPELLNQPLQYDGSAMIFQILDMIVQLFEYMKP